MVWRAVGRKERRTEGKERKEGRKGEYVVCFLLGISPASEI